LNLPEPTILSKVKASRLTTPASSSVLVVVPAPGPLLLLLVRLAALRDGAHVSRDPVRRPGPLVVLHELPLLEQLEGGVPGHVELRRQLVFDGRIHFGELQPLGLQLCRRLVILRLQGLAMPAPRGVELDEEVVLGRGDGVEGALRQDHHVRREDEGQEGGHQEEEPGDAAQAHGNRDSEKK